MNAGFYRRRLPHWFPENAHVFLTWRLAGSAPLPNPECLGPLTTQQHRDLFDTGPLWLRDARIAAVIENALRYGATVRRSYGLHAWVIMPNHVHAVIEPRVPVPEITC